MLVSELYIWKELTEREVTEVAKVTKVSKVTEVTKKVLRLLCAGEALGFFVGEEGEEGVLVAKDS